MKEDAKNKPKQGLNLPTIHLPLAEKELAELGIDTIRLADTITRKIQGYLAMRSDAYSSRIANEKIQGFKDLVSSVCGIDISTKRMLRDMFIGYVTGDIFGGQTRKEKDEFVVFMDKVFSFSEAIETVKGKDKGQSPISLINVLNCWCVVYDIQ